MVSSRRAFAPPGPRWVAVCELRGDNRQHSGFGQGTAAGHRAMTTCDRTPLPCAPDEGLGCGVADMGLG